MTQVFPPETGGVTPGDAVPGPDDFAAWLTTHPHLKTTKPKPVEALGLKGVSIDVRVKSSQPRKYKDCGKVEGDCVVMFVGKVEPIVYGSKSLGRFYVLEQPDGKQLVVEQYVEPASALNGAAAGIRCAPRVRARGRLSASAEPPRRNAQTRRAELTIAMRISSSCSASSQARTRIPPTRGMRGASRTSRPRRSASSSACALGPASWDRLPRRLSTPATSSPGSTRYQVSPGSGRA